MGSEAGMKEMRSSIAAFLSLSLLLLSRSEPPQQREVLLAHSHAAIADADKSPQALSHIFLKGDVCLPRPIPSLTTVDFQVVFYSSLNRGEKQRWS